MADIFSTAISTLQEMGFFNYFFPFILLVALFYALLRRSKALGDSPLLNGTVAIVISFMILDFQVLTNFNFQSPYSTFFTISSVFIVVFLVGFLFASFFYPNLNEFLQGIFVRRGTLFGMIALGLAIMLISGFAIFLTNRPPPQPGQSVVSSDTANLLAAIILFVVVLVLAMSIATSRGEGSE